MPPKLLALTAAAVLGLAGAVQAGGPGHATPEEVVAKVREAARYLAEAGGEGLARFKGRGSEYVWKDTYVFVADCDKRTIVAHPTMPVPGEGTSGRNPVRLPQRAWPDQAA